MILHPNDPRAVRNVRRAVPKAFRAIAQMVAYYGPRCDEDVPGCACCDGWRMFDATGRVPGEALHFDRTGA